MRALVVEPHGGGAPHLADRPEAGPGAGEALVRVLEVGVCGTDAEIVGGGYGEAPAGADALVLGHENLGVVAEVGPGATGVAPGDLVVATVRRPCPDACPNCRAGAPDMCTTGRFRERGIVGLDGFARERYVEDVAYLVAVPATLRPVAVLLEPLSVVEKGFRQAWEIQRRLAWTPRRALVVGAGPVGLLAALVARLEGLEAVVVDRVAADHPKAACVRALGAAYFRGGAGAPLPTDAGPFDLVLEATGHGELAFDAIPLLAPNGVLVRLGLGGTRGRACVPADAVNRELVLGNLVVVGSVSAHRQDYLAGVRRLEAAQARHPGWLARLITRRVPLEGFAAAFAREPDDIKVVLAVSPAGSGSGRAPGSP